MLSKVKYKIYNRILKFNRSIINCKNRIRLKNTDFSLISNNCNGAFILHDLHLKFLSPTVNLFLYPEDFIRFVENLKFYLEQEIIFIKKPECNYPVGKLNDIEIHFMHYTDPKTAKEKWEERSKRINFNNLFIMISNRGNYTQEQIRRFDNLPYTNKIMFTNNEYKQYSSTYYIKGFENEPGVGELFHFQNILGKKYYDNFDYVSWFNRGV